MAFDDIPDTFKEMNFAGSYDGSTWQQVKTFADYFEYNEYAFESATKGVGSNTWCIMVAVKRLIEKCDSLQAQIDAVGEPSEVTMDAILNAMWNSDRLRWFHFINYIDAMRAGIWNVEIYETHLADWYRHFSA